jgi:hypothetical protein
MTAVAKRSLAAFLKKKRRGETDLLARHFFSFTTGGI